MGKYVHEEVINGRLTVSTIKRTKADGNHVSTQVYASEEKVGEPESDYVFPIPLIYDFSIAARQAEAQTERRNL